MGIGYQASPLHRMIFANLSAISPVSESFLPPDFRALPGMRTIPWEEIEKHLSSPAPDKVISWRERIAAKYQPQLGEWADWDEGSSFEDGEDVSTHSDVLLRYVAAVLDLNGPTKAAGALLHRSDVPQDEIGARLHAAEAHGHGGGFPQLLLRAEIWLPFQSDRVFEEPDWEGRERRFGSVVRLRSEIAAIRDFIGRVDPAATSWHYDRGDAPTVLGAVWQCAEVLFRLATVGIERRLPMWTTG